MEAHKISAGVRELISFMDDKLKHYDPGERIAMLRSAADAYKNILETEMMKTLMAESLKNFFRNIE